MANSRLAILAVEVLKERNKAEADARANQQWYAGAAARTERM